MKIDLEKLAYAREHIDTMFCNTCGETEPKHGFYPLYIHIEARFSPVDCNCCRLEDKCPYCLEEAKALEL